MKKSFMSVLMLGALTVSTYAAAGCQATGCYGVTVDRLFVSNTGTIYIGTSGDESKLGCSSPNSSYLAIAKTDPGKNALFSTLLTAKTTRTKVNIRSIEGSTECRIAYIY